jgi:hypothetical protein
MAERLLGTGVELRVPSRWAGELEARDARDTHLGDLLGDLRIGGCDVTRFEFHAAPCHIELADELYDLLAASWREHPPR